MEFDDNFGFFEKLRASSRRYVDLGVVLMRPDTHTDVFGGW